MAEPLLKDRIALVTGATGGLGVTITEALASAGAAVAIHYRGQAEQTKSVVASVEALGQQAVAVKADVTNWDEVGAMVAEVQDHLGRIDILVNNAGVMEETPFLEVTPEGWAQTIAVDLTGVFNCTRHVIPGMLAGDGGSVINISSQLAFKGAAGLAAYCAAKGGVVGLTRALAREFGPRIRVNAVAPGPVETPMIAEYATPEWQAERTGGLVIGRLGRSEEVAPVVVFLASEGAALLHGQTLHPNGGGVMP